MRPTTLVLIRHGHTSSNGGADARLSGVSDVPLSERGAREAALLAAHLAARDERFVAIVSSPLSRAVATARALVRAGLGELEIVHGLREIDCGEYDGELLAVVQQRLPDHWAANLRQQDPDFRWPGGESYREFRTRCLETVSVVARNYAGDRVAIVTHAGVISQLLGHVFGIGEACWESYRPGNSAVTELIWDGASTRLVRFDDRSHLG